MYVRYVCLFPFTSRVVFMAICNVTFSIACASALVGS
jgi:hypothetical protein